MQTLENKGKINNASSNHDRRGVNGSGTRPKIDAWLTQRCSLPVQEGERVYFILCGDYIKVGFSTNPHKRLASMQTGSPFELVLLADIPGSKDDEQEIHRMFPDLHFRGEWFRDDPRIRAFIEATKIKRPARRRRMLRGPIQYELVSRNGDVYGPFESLSEAKYNARHSWPDQQQDPDRTGKGWDIQVVGS